MTTAELDQRLVCVWIPDWPVLCAMAAAEVAPSEPAAVHNGRVLTAVSAAARALGVRRGMRRRQAQGIAAHIHLFTVDEDRDARIFEPIAVALEKVVAGLEVIRPGLVLIPAGGATRYWGDDETLIRHLLDTVVAATGFEVQAGIADGILAATLAAREFRIVPTGETAQFLARHELGALEHLASSTQAQRELGHLIDLWRRLGLYTLADLAALPAADVHARFGYTGAWAHELASGGSERPPALRRIPMDIAVQEELDPPVARVDQAAFAARRLAEQLHAELVGAGRSCARLRIVARTDAGVELVRTWRTDAAVLGALDAGRISDRVRWQLEGWLTAASLERRGEDYGHAQSLTYLGIFAEEIMAAGVHQDALWGQASGTDSRAHRALLRVQSVLGPEAVVAPVRQGGRDPRQQVTTVPWGQAPTGLAPVDRPWAGRLPTPSPATLLAEPVPVQVRDEAGHVVEVDARGQMASPPASVRWDGSTRQVSGWAGPWPLDERWWAGGVPGVWLQVQFADADAVLLCRRQGEWYLEGRYD